MPAVGKQVARRRQDGVEILNQRAVGLAADDEAARPSRHEEYAEAADVSQPLQHPAGLLGLADPIKPTAVGAVLKLLRMGLEVVLVTGDMRKVAIAVAGEVGIDQVESGMLPAGKVQVIKRLQAAGKRVAMVGDGINDAPALAAADVGIAIGTGTDVAVEAAEITLLTGDLRAAVTAIELARATMRTIRQNLFWAFAYNVLGIPIAAGALYPLTGLLLSPVLASAAMAFSSVAVVTNSLRLSRFAPTFST